MRTATTIRDAFVKGIDRCQPGIAPIAVDAELNRIAGLVWNCTDVLPGEYCQMLDLAAGSSTRRQPATSGAAAEVALEETMLSGGRSTDGTVSSASYPVGGREHVPVDLAYSVSRSRWRRG